MTLLIKGALVVDHCGVAPVDIAVENGTIIGTFFDIDPSEGDTIFDARGLICMPGLIDIHTHLSLEVGKYTSADDFDTGTAAAIAGGTTTIVDYISPAKGESLSAAIDRWFEKAQDSRIDYSFHLCLTDDSESTMAGIEHAVGRGIRGFKVFMAYPDRYMMTPLQIMNVMKKVKECGGVLFVHTEDGNEIESLRAKSSEQNQLSMAEHARTRPAYQELNAAKVLYELVRETFCPTVIVHISAAEVLEVLRDASLKGIPLFGETCPQYLWLNDTMLDRPWPESAPFVCSPPLRNIEHLDALWDGLITGDIDVVSTDHCPFNMEDRMENGEDFRMVPNGLAGIENRFMLLQNGAITAGRFGWTRLVRLLSTNAAILSGLYPRKGTIRPGSDADLIFFDPASVTSFNSEDLFSGCDHNPYDGMQISGSVAVVLSRGEVVYDNGILTAEKGRGQFIPRSRVKPDRLWAVKMEDFPWAFCQ
ncbi:dihydropyrimidinase [Myxococcota bacterium]|nr:dihydropyrimidinase [Myxococcota bacterium]MBU1380712.1 dihydropyrimidinase [Myxococcota bacterium]MBU1498060.1 dihydropyrimidinase [Myxococcota bacterium]